MNAKKLVAVGMTTLMLGGLFVGCGNSADTSSTEAKSGENVKITIFQSKIEANDGYKKLIAAYEKDHPNVEINLEAVTGNDFGASLKAKMQSDPPTIFSVGGFSDMKDYADVLEDLSDLDIMKHTLEGTTDTFTKDGKVYAVPLYMEGYGFVINKQMFEDAGVSVDSMMNFEGMKAGFDTLKEKIDNGEMKDKYVNVALTHDFKTPNEAYAADSLPGTGFEDYKKMVDFQASYTTNADNTANLNSVDYTTSLEGGLAIERVACIKQGNWVAPAVETTDPEVLQKLDMLPYSVPGYSDGKYFVGVSGYWAIHNKSTDAQKAAAKDFINWMFSDPEAQKIVVNDCKFIPPYDNFDGMQASDPLSQRIMDANNSGNTMNGWVYSGAPNTWSQQVAGVEVQKYLAGEADWDEVTKTCIEQWSALRKQQNN